jgi:hypothetical protein
MKKTIILLLILALAAGAFAQKDETEGMGIYPVNGSFFAGHKNQFYFTGPGATQGKLSIVIDRGTLEKKDNTFYMLTLPEGCPARIDFSIMRDSSGIKKLIYTISENVLQAPEPILFPLFAGAYGKIKKETILENPVITLVSYHEFLNLDWEQFTVTEFSLTMDVLGDLITEPGKGNKFSARQIERITKAEKGQKFFIEDIKAVGDRGTKKIIRPIAVIID